jgi:hypothetical protein
MKTTPWILGIFVIGLGCNGGKQNGPGEGEAGSEESGTQGGSETGAPETGGPPDGDSSSGSEGSGSSGCNFFMCGPDPTGDEPLCDQWAQDCGDGYKCAAWANDGSNAWNSTKCVEVMPNAGVPGDECTVEGSGVSGVDSCAAGAMCWDVDPETNKGVCVGLCLGTPDAPICDPGQACAVANDVLNLCLPSCDPLAQDCPGDDLCLPSGEGFLCVLDASGEEGQAFDPCEYGNACDAGLYCVDVVYGKECDSQAAGCCLPFCDTGAVECPGDGQSCIAWYEAGQAPPGFDTVGICGIPQ